MINRPAFRLWTGMCAAAIIFVACGGGTSGPAPEAISSPPAPSATPPARLLYVDHNGTLYQYQLPLVASSRPLHAFVEDPDGGTTPFIAVDRKGNVTVTTDAEIRVFTRPIRSFQRTRAEMIIPLTPAITQIGSGGKALLADTEYDPSSNLWLLSQLGEISELTAPLSPDNVAALTIGFGDPGTKSSGYAPQQMRFDVNAALYVFAENGASHSQLFKTSYPYAKPPSPLGISLFAADFIDSSQYLPTNPAPAPLALGQYIGPLSSPPPGSPPPIPVDELAQFAQPFNPVLGLFPNAVAKVVISALAADAPRELFYTLESSTGRLDVYALPLQDNAVARIRLSCLAGPSNCDAQSQHLFLSP